MKIPGQEIVQIAEDAERWTPQEILRWGLDRWHPRIALASSFGAEGMVLIDMASRIRPDLRIFTLDTGFFFPETYELIERVERRYGVRIERVEPSLTPSAQARIHGEALWSRDPDRCCELRKIDPLRKKLQAMAAWITAIRREQSSSRATMRKIHWDNKFGRVKLNPLAHWRSSHVWEYIRLKGVPYNPLHDRGYPSIGCTHCTRAVLPGENPRAGRWPGFVKIECGLHTTETE